MFWLSGCFLILADRFFYNLSVAHHGGCAGTIER
jgi:hypothetical protein